jgi:hypothetical protein
MPDKAQFVGRWVHWDGTARIEQELFDDGRFDGVVFDEEQDAVFGKASGKWEIISDAIQWRYTSSENLPVPKKPQLNPIIHVDQNRFDVRENSRSTSDWYRIVESEDTSTNFDLEQLQPFLERIAAHIDSGFGSAEIATVMKKVQRLKPDQTCQFVFPVTFKGTAAPFRIRVFMDDIDAPDAYFYGPTELARQIDHEIRQLDSR